MISLRLLGFAVPFPAADPLTVMLAKEARYSGGGVKTVLYCKQNNISQFIDRKNQELASSS